MTDFPMKRREFLVGVGVSGLGLVFGLDLKPATGAATEVDKEGTGAGVKMAWVRIAPDGAITIMAPAAEMGQGTMTALAVVFAEELDADWNKVAIEFSPSDDSVYGSPLSFFFGMMITAASTAVMAYYKNMRLYGAQARRVLLDAARLTSMCRCRNLRRNPAWFFTPKADSASATERSRASLRCLRLCPPCRKKILRIRASSG